MVQQLSPCVTHLTMELHSERSWFGPGKNYRLVVTPCFAEYRSWTEMGPTDEHVEYRHHNMRWFSPGLNNHLRG